jgi:hypothetical protein
MSSTTSPRSRPGSGCSIGSAVDTTKRSFASTSRLPGPRRGASLWNWPPRSGRLGGTDRGTRRQGRPPGEEGPEARPAERGAAGDTDPGERRRQAQHRGTQSRHRPGPGPRRGSRSARTCANPVTGGGR